MTRYLLFQVTDATWVEHNTVGIAAINDPGINVSRQANALRQTAIAEISGIGEEDILFFNLMRGSDHPPQILGVYQATSTPYFDDQPLYPGATEVSEKLSLRVEFKCVNSFPKAINIDQVWGLKEQGRIWTIQQSRGDVLGRHACSSMTRDEAMSIWHLLVSNNVTEGALTDYSAARQAVGLAQIPKQQLPLDVRESAAGQLHYEAALQSLILEGLAAGKYKDVLGEYDEFIPYVATGARSEVDLLLMKHFDSQVAWYQVIELKAAAFTEAELQRLIDYEKWFVQTRAQSALQVHPIGIAAHFDEYVLNFVNERIKYRDRAIRLIEYQYDSANHSISLFSI